MMSVASYQLPISQVLQRIKALLLRIKSIDLEFAGLDLAMALRNRYESSA
jgi:hypothetical protein